ncbi:hypothetical protein Nepgr_008921 [Nepenthes gracilis]|uniref:Bulb-type lectin domain-containing protein n=1 Tax=Nepenthes gracilis TaxID=150966 RepID=A0AAD3XJX7_NEPGR|nr:hypothetical protein Nepgr_008921 [Nepenthes gracilis]
MSMALAGSPASLGYQPVQFPHVRVSKFVLSKLKADEGERQLLLVASASMKTGLGSSRRGAGLLERPTFDQSQFDPATQVQEGGDIGRVRDKRGAGSGDSYRVLLLDDERHTENLVAKVVPQIVPSVTPDDARKLFNQSRQNGVAVVTVTVKEHAEFYAQMMIRGGLRSSIEPDSNVILLLIGLLKLLLSDSGDLMNTIEAGSFLLAMQFNKMQQKTIVWSASGAQIAQSGSRIELTTDGSFILNDPSGRQLWSVPLADTGLVAYAAMLNSGNLVLATNASAMLWQSFDSPTIAYTDAEYRW